MTAVTLEEDKRNCYEKIKNRLLTNNFYDRVTYLTRNGIQPSILVTM